MKIEDVLYLFNEEGLTLEEVGKKLGTSKSSVYRLLSKHNYKFNASLQKYVPLNEIMEQSLNEKSNNDSNETTNNLSVSRTYQIPSDLDRALKIKCAIEGTKIVDVVRDALLSVVEEKYYKL